MIIDIVSVTDKQLLMPFKPGQSGNPSGRKPGAGRVGKLREKLEPHAGAVIEKTVEMALGGDVACLRMLLDRLLPAIRSRDEPVKLTGLKSDMKLSAQGAAVVRALASGQLSPTEGSSIMSALGAQAKLSEAGDLAQRVEELERSLAQAIEAGQERWRAKAVQS
jgi:hypothetical protein